MTLSVKDITLYYKEGYEKAYMMNCKLVEFIIWKLINGIINIKDK